jgi:hypothetical protein
MVNSNGQSFANSQFDPPLFYCDVDDDLGTLKGAKSSNARRQPEYGLAPFLLGEPLELWYRNEISGNAYSRWGLQ